MDEDSQNGGGSDQDNERISLDDIREELNNLKTSALDLNRKINYLENNIKKFILSKEEIKISQETPTPIQPIPIAPKITSKENTVPDIPVIQEKEERSDSEEKSVDFEFRMGRYWLNRIGILVLATGIGFLISYTFKYFGAFAKIMIGYLLSVGLFAFGSKLENNSKFIYYGRSLLGGAWAIAYFTTYAMYHFPASRLISNQLLGLFLLGIVALAMLVYTLKYKSQELSAMALFVGYFTATLGDINSFTLASILILAVITMILVYKMRWLNFIFMGIILTYLTHIFWVGKHLYSSSVTISKLNVQEVYFWLNSSFLFLYWLLFTISIYLLSRQNEKNETKLAVASFSNFLIFFILTYGKVFFEYPEFKFQFILGLGIIYALLAILSFKLKNQKLYATNTLIALSLLTFSIPLRTVPLNTTFLWLIELPCILYIGLYLHRKIFRIFSLALALVLLVKIQFDYYSAWSTYVIFPGFTYKDLILLAGTISSFLCSYLNRRLKGNALFKGEKFLLNIYSALGAWYLTILIWNIIPNDWLTFSLLLETSVLFIIGFLLRDRYLRSYSMIILLIVSLRLLFWDKQLAFDFPRWVVFAIEFSTYYLIYFLYRNLRLKAVLRDFEKIIPQMIVLVANLILGITLWNQIPAEWASMTMALELICLFLIGLLLKEWVFRGYALALFIISTFRIFFIDNSYNFDGLSWWRIIIGLSIYYLFYFLYNNLKLKKVLGETEDFVPATIFTITTSILTIILLRQVERNFVSLALGIEGAGLVTTGFVTKDKGFRIGGFGVFALTLLRIIFIDLSGIHIIYKIISFIILGIIFLIISFLYNRYSGGRGK